MRKSDAEHKTFHEINETKDPLIVLARLPHDDHCKKTKSCKGAMSADADFRQDGRSPVEDALAGDEA